MINFERFKARFRKRGYRTPIQQKPANIRCGRGYCMGRKTIRVIFDVLLTIMIVFEMFIQYTGNFLHEVIGFAFFATVVAHLILSAKWMKSVARSAKKGRLSMRNGMLAAMGILLAGTMLVLGVSSVAISNILSSAGMVWTIGSYSTWATVHAASSYLLCALVVMHLAMHWAFLASAFKVEYNPARRRAINAGVHAIAGVGAIALGITAIREVSPQTTATIALADDSDRRAFENPSDIVEESTSSPESAAAESANTANTDGKGNRHHSKGGKRRAEQIDNTSSSETADTSDEPNSYGIPNGQENVNSYEDQNALDKNTYDYSEPEEFEQPNISTASGTCPLCHKNCPLSAPQCNKPYEAGLI